MAQLELVLVVIGPALLLAVAGLIGNAWEKKQHRRRVRGYYRR
jgi:hypothetical protein